MQILVLNGSPRMNGNTRTALNRIIFGIKKNMPAVDVNSIDVTKLNMSGCTNCDECKCNGGVCVMQDDSAELMEKVSQADTIIVGTPVYWWGMSSQMKMVIDKFYSKDEQFHTQNKKVGIVVVGASPTDDKQYQLIGDQFRCICEYLGWRMVFDEPISAFAEDDVAANSMELFRLGELWKML